MLATISCLAQEIAELSQTFNSDRGTTAELPWSPPEETPRGYGVNLRVLDKKGRGVATASSAFDVLENWTQAPRYGFLTDFSPDRDDINHTAAWLAKYHLNGIQFYDWMYRHDQLLPPSDTYLDPLGRQISLKTIRYLIEAAHTRNAAAMPYSAIYGASIPFHRAHPDWSLFDADGTPIGFEGFLMIMDPTPNSPWGRHVLAQYQRVLKETAFDGIHIDQYGDPKTGYDARGNPVDLSQVFPAFIDAAQSLVRRERGEDGAVIFNAVRAWPVDSVAPAEQDAVYIEVWPPDTLYQHLHQHIVAGQDFGRGKRVILAAYVDPENEHNARLTDATIFASGGFHIELGEPGGMLADPYFPKYGRMSQGVTGTMRRYYDFVVRYENVLSQGTRDTTPEQAERVQIEGTNTDPAAIGDKVWVITREGVGFETISLVNLLGIRNPTWNGHQVHAPAAQTDLRVRTYTKRPVQSVWWSTPDFGDLRAQPIDFNTGRDRFGDFVEFLVPSLAYWDLIVLEESNYAA